MRRLFNTCAGLVLALGVAGAANAAVPIYGSPGTENPTNYIFTAAATGDVKAYFAGYNASYDEYLGLLVNGVDSGVTGLPNHSTPLGTELDFGPVTAGDALTFYIYVNNTGDKFYSDKSMNSDGFNHVWAINYAGGDYGIPAGKFVAFEDLHGGGDKDYNDETFVFTNVGGVPEPATWALMITGFGAAGAMLRKARKLAIATA